MGNRLWSTEGKDSEKTKTTKKKTYPSATFVTHRSTQINDSQKIVETHTHACETINRDTQHDIQDDTYIV